MIVPVYNVQPYLARCVESVVHQSFTEWELILVDDGSTDRSGELCDAYAAGDPRICALHQPNAGANAARSAGLDRARAGYVMFVDSDDYLLPGALMALIRRALALDADMVVGDMLREESATGRRRPIRNSPPERRERTGLLEALMMRRVASSLAARVIRTDLLRGIRLPAELVMGEDSAATCMLFTLAGRIEFVAEPVYCYVRRADSITEERSARTARSRIDLIRWIERYFADKPCRRDPSFEGAMYCFLLIEFYAFLRSGGRRCPDAALQRRITREWLVHPYVVRHLPAKVLRTLRLYRRSRHAGIAFVRCYMALRTLRLRLGRLRRTAFPAGRGHVGHLVSN